MRVGLQMVFQNAGRMSDAEMYRNEMKLAELAEPLGFDSLWPVEHHFDDYAMCPDNTQFLSWLAGRTSRISLGTGAVILPWNNPLRVVEKMVLLDHLSNGRALFGMGRGLARLEYEGFMVDMNEARERFDEAAKMILEGLETGVVEGKGPFYPQKRTEVRPRPLQSFRDRAYSVAMSPDSIDVVGELGVRMMIFSQFKPESMRENFDKYRRIYRENHRAEAPPPVIIDFLYCDRDAARAEAKAREHVIAYFFSVLRHYEMLDEHFSRTKGYESYARAAEIMRAAGKEASAERYLEQQAWGTPQQILDRLERRWKIAGDFEINVCPSYAGLPYEDAEASLRLFAEEVMPELQRWNIEEPERVEAEAQ